MTVPSIPGLSSVEFLAADGAVRSYRAVDSSGGFVRAFLSDQQSARERLQKWAEVEPNSRWIEMDGGGALVCRWPDAPSQGERRVREDPRAALEACLPCLDELAHAHQLGVAHGGVEMDSVHFVDGRFILPPPRPESGAGGVVADLRDVKALVSRILSPDPDATLVSAQAGPGFVAEVMRILDEEQESVSELRDRLRGLFGNELEQPTIVSGQIPVAESQITLPESVGGFEIRRLLGKGGMGYVFEAFDAHLEREIALKTVRLDILGEAGKERFLREARACSRITHPNIVTVYSAGEADGDPYMAMELVRGQTLADRLKEGAVAWETLVGWIVQILDALERLHAEGIVHRDLKPDNVMLTEEGVPKLMDFGLAHMAAAAQLTATGMMVGTVHYMSPEQVLGGEIDARSDVFSMGVLLYRALSGNFPFEGDHPMSIMYAIQNAEPPKLDVASLDVPPELASIIERSLAKERGDRFTSAGPFRDALSALIGPAERVVEIQRSRTPWIVAAAVAVVAAGVLYWSMNRGADAPDRSAAIRHNQLGTQFEGDDLLADARAEYLLALEADATYAVAWNNLGMLAAGDRQWAEADSMLKTAAELDSTYATAPFNRGSVLEAMRRPAWAQKSYASAIAADSSFAPAYNNLAAVLADRSLLTEAREVILRGLSNVAPDEPLRPYLERTCGRVFHELGDEDSAIAHWRTALEGLPDEASLHESLASALQRRDGLDAARPHWERLRALGDDDQRQRAIQALAEGR